MNKIELKDMVGGAWKMEAVKRIKAYLEEALKDTGIIVFA